MKAFYQQDFRLGILGGGQLGRMLIQASPISTFKPMFLTLTPVLPVSK